MSHLCQLGTEAYGSFLWERQHVPRSAGRVGQQCERAAFRSGELERWKVKASCEIIAVCGFVHIYKGIED